MSNDYEKLIELITTIVGNEGNWRDKRDNIRASITTTNETTAFDEFISWFEPEEE